MSVDVVLRALGLPPQALVDKRVPKATLIEHGTPTTADRRRVNEGIEELRWVAALKPGNIGVPAYSDAEREYLEIVVLAATLRSTAKVPRLVEVIHRSIPYPALLVTSEPGGRTGISFAHKRFAQNEGGKVVAERVWAASIEGMGEGEPDRSFLGSLALAILPRDNLAVLYGAWVACAASMEASRVSGVFVPPRSGRNSEEVDASLQEHSRITREIAGLRAQARKEKQIRIRVDLNTKIGTLKAELEGIRKRLAMENDR
jgi:hypothetical protein